MDDHLFMGRQVQLLRFEPEQAAQFFEQWNQDSEYQRLIDSIPAYLVSINQIEQRLKERKDEISYLFMIRTLEETKYIGFVELDGVNWSSGNAWLGMGIGDAKYRGKGYGSDALNLILQFAFDGLNLRRISLNFFEYNQHARRTYEKAGFQHEGRERQWLSRAGRRWDLVYMGILYSEWKAHNFSRENK